MDYLDAAAARLESFQQQHTEPSATSQLTTPLSVALETYTQTSDLTRTFVQLLPELLRISESAQSTWSETRTKPSGKSVWELPGRPSLS